MFASLKTLKETLKPCSSSSSSSSSSSLLPSSSDNNWRESEEARLSQITRKPPKSNLSQQLLRLGEPSFPTLDPPLSQPSTRVENRFSSGRDNDDDDDGEEQETVKLEGFGRPKSARVVYDHTGPYEPLLLSSPGEQPNVKVPASINCRLLEHQREGVKFLYRLYRNNHGGILGDDMGLGKTIQTIAFLAAVYGKEGESSDSGILKDRKGGEKGHVLIICPTSVIHNWESEFSTWATFNVAIYQGSNRDLMLEKLEARGAEILITSFDTFRIYGSILAGIKWEIVVVDEAHRLKNDKSKLYAACLQIGTRKRIGLTGTVMQNKIMELFNLFDWVAPGCLGTREHFREFYDEPLKHGQRSGAPERFVRVADKRKEHLVTVLRKYMIRRTKEETIGHLMMGKEDNVVFCAMSELQKRVYRRMLQLPEIQCLINKDLQCTCGSPLKQVECCKRTVPDGIIWSYLHRDNPEGCDSCPFCLVLPCLVKLQQVSNHLELVKPNPKDEEDKQKKDAEFCSAVFGADADLVGGNAQNEDFMGLSDVIHCGKMRVLEKLLSSWTSRGDKILLFSYSVRMLDILEKFIIRKGYSFSRLDGSTPTNIRQCLVDDFNKSPSKQVFLISTRAGGLGLNLVSANRVVIFDPNWNPAQDLQAQDRSFRFGQKRHVVVFRLLAAGSFEELIYSRQIYKQQLANIAVSGKTEKRYFEGVQDCKELQGELFGICNLFRDLSDELFTSGIIKSHEGQREGERHDSTLSQKLGELGTDNHPQTYADDPGPEIFCPSNFHCSESSRPALEELGVLYAHRNEDVVNVYSGTGNCNNRPGEDTAGEVGEAVSVKDKSSGGDDAKDGNKNQKRIQYRLLAKFTGMEVLEFSKWVLSATPLERKDVLRNYARKNTIQRKRKRRPKD